MAVRGWTESTQVPVADAVERAESAGVRRFIYTDVARDGTLSEPNFHAIEALLRQTDVALLAAGGISSVAHLERLARIGVEAAIVGKAMYTGDVDLAQAIEAVSGLR